MPQVLLFSGHMIDAPDRDALRFPPQKEQVVRARLAEVLAEWRVGAGDLCICGGARGGDLLFAELCLERGAEVHVFLALPRDAFVEASVRLPPESDAGWVGRFARVLRRAVVHEPGPETAGDAVFAEANSRMIAAAREAAEGGRVSVLLLWDGAEGGAGGTGDVARRVQDIAGRIAVVDPTRLEP